jgi:hypothetical protein
MTLGGWITLTLSLGFVLGLFVWCLRRLFYGSKAPDEKHLAHIELVHDEKKPKRR